MGLGPRNYAKKTITVNVQALSNDFAYSYPTREIARDALDAWEKVTGIDFVEVSHGAQIIFREDFEWIKATPRLGDGKAIGYEINIRASLWDYYATEEFAERNFYRLYLHEIGHALGLRHPHDEGHNFEDDVIQKTVMSYNYDKNDPWPASPMIADINAVKTLWGSKSELGDNVYNLMELRKYDGSVMSISDDGGHDWISVNHSTTGTIIDLRPGSASKVESKTNNVFIHKDTVIEDVYGSIRDDVITGNYADNDIFGSHGNDKLYGGPKGGDDTLDGGTGDDKLYGGIGNDVLYGGEGDDFLSGGPGVNILYGGDGADTFRFKPKYEEYLLIPDFETQDKIMVVADKHPDVYATLLGVRVESEGSEMFLAGADLQVVEDAIFIA